ncbi:dienelactone hydrolase family protein [Prauserella oleivorans]|uniref:Dienelactone hydrolase family protein n=1 Tax=Prauserella oleivorans TaxID=1478153 RepID=A0ABW5WI82_9PSEU
MTQTFTDDYQRADGRGVQLTFAEPDRAVRGGVVVLHEAEGVTAEVQELLAALASDGWLAVAPDIAGGGSFDGRSVLAATDVTLAWLADREVRADLIGVMGFDLGGTAALVVAARRKLGAAVSVGGRGVVEPVSDALPALVDIAGELSSPWLGLYGDDGDEAAEAEIERLREAAASAPVAANVIRYPGASHRFDADPAAAAEAWQRTLDWFGAYLR